MRIAILTLRDALDRARHLEQLELEQILTTEGIERRRALKEWAFTVNAIRHLETALEALYGS